jgi:lipoate-protein ligase A
MKYLELTCADPARDLACDEALLETFEAERCDDGLLRIWQPDRYFVVLGHSNRVNGEVNVAACTAGGVPILRRTSGGGAVVQGPGCLNYSLILDSAAHKVPSIRSAFGYVLERHRQWIAELTHFAVSVAGVSDLTVDGRKFSGNAQYRKARYVLVHGTFLLAFELSLMDRYLFLPTRQPAYRENRPHVEFVSNLNVEGQVLRKCLRENWNADTDFNGLGSERIDTLVLQRYGKVDWSNKF